MKKINDYLHLYKGSMCHVDAGQFSEQTLPIIGSMDRKAILGNASLQVVEMVDCKPILRLLKDMTDQEAIEIGNIAGGMSHISDESKAFQIKELLATNGYYVKQTNLSGSQWNKIINYCREKSFDMDSLLHDGLAIEKKD